VEDELVRRSREIEASDRFGPGRSGHRVGEARSFMTATGGVKERGHRGAAALGPERNPNIGAGGGPAP
jgi:hypothetical protein